MNTNITTPLDELAKSIMDQASDFRNSGPLSKSGMLLLAFTNTLRIFYKQLKATSIITIPPQQINSVFYMDDALEHKFAYQGFISAINQYGRSFKDVGIALPPKFYRVKFYRDKLVEHWGDYVEYILSTGSITAGNMGQIFIPYHSFTITNPLLAQAARDKIIQEFANCNVVLPLTNEDWYGVYAEKIYSALEQIDKNIWNDFKNDNGKIPNSLVNAIFSYSFPSPICDIEAYCEEIKEYAKNIPLR